MKHKYFDVGRSCERCQQEFSPLVNEYFLDRNGELQLKPVQRDQQALINSVEYTKLSEIFDMLTDVPRDSVLASMREVDDIILERENYLTDLDILNQADLLLENYRSETNSGSKMSKAQLVSQIKAKAAEAEQNIINKRKELFVNETKQDTSSQQSEQA